MHECTKSAYETYGKAMKVKEIHLLLYQTQWAYFFGLFFPARRVISGTVVSSLSCEYFVTAPILFLQFTNVDVTFNEFLVHLLNE